ncbi:MAG: DUF1294 domain-containing protein [Planctomycetes bacterium]|nr:DUF1294 domain-containing protein [Planctomycetota bacterium]
MRRRIVAADVPLFFDRLPPGTLITAAIPFAVGAASLWFRWPRLGAGYLALLTILSAIGFRLAILDKIRAAEGADGAGRIRERTLHTIEVLGGWPGALVAQYGVRHKTTKASYRRAFALLVALHLALIALVGWALSRVG